MACSGTALLVYINEICHWEYVLSFIKRISLLVPYLSVITHILRFKIGDIISLHRHERKQLGLFAGIGEKVLSFHVCLTSIKNSFDASMK
jgi:hypothetical protein